MATRQRIINRSTKLQHRSARGVIVDMDALRAKNAKSPAIGNASMNAHGDVIGRDGKILVPRERIVQQYYANNPRGVKHASLKQGSAENFETPKQAVERLSREINSKTRDTNARNAQLDRPRNVIDKSKRHLIDKSK
jgi:hypothetical protein